MYLREWKCRCPQDTADDFIDYLKQTGVKDTQEIEACMAYEILKRKLGDDIEITFHSFWLSFESMKMYAGENIYRAVLYPDDEKYRITPNTEVKVYEIMAYDFDHDKSL